MLDVLIDSIIDTAYLIPFLLVVHVIIEIIEVKGMKRLTSGKLISSAAAPAVGTAVALLPQCGFSVIASELYAKRHIAVGTLIAVFIATSDEALPILFGAATADPSVFATMGQVIAIKAITAISVGFLVNLFFKGKGRSDKQAAAKKDDVQNEECSEPHNENAHSHTGCCGHSHTEHDKKGFQSIWHTYLKHPVVHTLIIMLYIFAITFILGTIIHLVETNVGENAFNDFLNDRIYLQPLLASLVGLIPNCASSVMLTEMLIGGSLSLGAAVSGLTVNAGLGFAVLFKQNKSLKGNLLILSAVMAVALIVGYVVTAVSLAFI